MQTNINTIDFVLTYQWFDEIKAGRKTHEYRKVSVWENRLFEKIHAFEKEDKPLQLRLRRGYTKTFMLFNIKSVSLSHGLLTDLKCDELVYDFELGKLLNFN